MLYFVLILNCGKRNEFGYVKLVVEKIVELKEMKYSEIVMYLIENVKKLFKIKD